MKLAALSSALVATSLFVVSPSARAQESGTTLPTDATLRQLIDQSLEALPELAQSQAVVRAQEERVPQAGAFPDPMLQIGIQNDGFTSIEIGRMGTSYVSFMASQTFPWPGKRGLRHELAELGVSGAKQSIVRVRLSTEAEVRRAYLDLLLLRERGAFLDQLEAIWQRSLGAVQAKYETGSGAQSDLLRAQLELRRIQQRRIALDAERQTRQQALNRLRDHPLEEPIELKTRLRDLPTLDSFERLFSTERALAQSPELADARLDLPRAAKSIALAEKSYYPDLTVGAGIMVRGALPPMWVLTVGGPVPVFAGSKQRRSIAENRAWSSVAQKQIDILEQGLRLRTAQRRAAFSALRQTLDVYNQGLLAQSEATITSTLSQYTIGKVTFASVLEANAGFIGDQEGYLESIAEAYRLLIAEVELSLAPTTLPMGAVGGSAAMPGAGSSSGGAMAGGPSGGRGEPAVSGGSTPSGSGM